MCNVNLLSKDEIIESANSEKADKKNFLYEMIQEEGLETLKSRIKLPVSNLELLCSKERHLKVLNNLHYSEKNDYRLNSYNK